MELYTLEVINLYKNNIEYKIKKKNRSFKKIFILPVVLIALTAIAYSTKYIAREYYLNLTNYIHSFYNPINPLYNDLGKIIFTSGDVYSQYDDENTVDLILPIFTANSKIENGVIEFVVEDNIMVSSSANGVVVEVGEDNGKKFVIIKHSKNISTKYQNIELVGVAPGEEVKSGDYIATSKKGDVVVFSVINNGKQINNLKITTNKIEFVNE